MNKREATAGLNFYSLSSLRSNKFIEPVIVKYPAINKTPTKRYEHPGEEFIFVLKGMPSILTRQFPIGCAMPAIPKVNALSSLQMKFMFTGTIMEAGGISRRIIDFANALVGWLPGGLAAVTIHDIKQKKRLNSIGLFLKSVSLEGCPL